MAFWDKFKKKAPQGAAAPEGAKAPPVRSSAPPARERRGDTGSAYRVLRAPVASEKSARLGGENVYVFEIADGANKLEVKEAVFRAYGVRPVSVAIVRLPGHAVRFGGRVGRARGMKKAIVKLPPGKTISIYEGV